MVFILLTYMTIIYTLSISVGIFVIDIIIITIVVTIIRWPTRVTANLLYLWHNCAIFHLNHTISGRNHAKFHGKTTLNSTAEVKLAAEVKPMAEVKTRHVSKNMEDVEEKIEYLFYKGYTYEEIVGLLSVDYGIQLSLSTLKRKLKDMNLSRKNLNFDVNLVRQAIEELIDGPNSCVGYRSIWHTLKLRGTIVPRLVIQQLMQEIDPEGVQARKAHRLRRRQYYSPGPNSVWHADGYDKLKLYGLPIHGCIDGFSRKVIWLYVTRSNNYPDNIAAYSLDSVKELGGCPRKLNTDLGTENGTMAGIHCFFMDKFFQRFN